MTPQLPKGACDCHAHVFGPLQRFEFSPLRSYTPSERLAAEYRDVLSGGGIQRGIIVQPSVYGTDNSATLSAIAELGGQFRGVAVLPADVSDTTLADCAAGGIRGVRVSDLLSGGVPLDDLEAIADRIRGTDWHVQIFTRLSQHSDLPSRVGKLGIPVVIDHFGLIDCSLGTQDPGLATLRELLASGQCWAKLSAPYLMSHQPMPYDDIAPVASALAEMFGDRLVWGSDWPHPASGDAPPDYTDLLQLLSRWVPDDETRRRILVDNPITLYGFPPP